jgi:cytidylate kinase
VESYASVEEARDRLIERSQVEQKRFLELYGMDYYDYRNYNLVLDSTARTPEEMVDAIWASFANYQADPVRYAHVELL